MLSINLLSKQEKKNIRLELYIRFVLAVAGALSAFLLIFAVLLVPAYLFLTFQKNEFIRRAAIEKEGQKIANVEMTIAKITDLNEQATALASRRKTAYGAGATADSIAQLASPELSFNDMSFDIAKKEIVIQGTAKHRQDLLALKSALESLNTVSKVISPLSNVIQESNFNFTLTVRLK